jgi:hypothetical protein
VNRLVAAIAKKLGVGKPEILDSATEYSIGELDELLIPVLETRCLLLHVDRHGMVDTKVIEPAQSGFRQLGELRIQQRGCVDVHLCKNGFAG